MARYLYSLLYYFLLPLVLLRLLWRSFKAPDYRRRIAERFAFFKALPFTVRPIHIHAVSVGEVVAALPLIKELQRRYPHIPLLVTTTTPTGAAQLAKALAEYLHQGTIAHLYMPYDLPDAVERFTARTKARLFLIIETELWPNLLASYSRKNIPSVLVNARLSQKSARGYARFQSISQEMLQHLSAVFAQSQADGARFLTLGLAQHKLHIMGNIKFDLELDAAIRQQAQQLRAQWSLDGHRAVLIAASTHQGEDEIILDAFALLLKRSAQFEQAQPPLLVLVPRHPERFTDVVKMAVKNFKVQRYSTADSDAQTQVLVADVMGKLLLFYGAADIAFIGGSLIQQGGHNMLEAAAWSLPLISGKSLFNFQLIAEELISNGALLLVENAQQLAATWAELLADASCAARVGAAANNYQRANQGALLATLQALTLFLAEG